MKYIYIPQVLHAPIFGDSILIWCEYPNGDVRGFTSPEKAAVGTVRSADSVRVCI